MGDYGDAMMRNQNAAVQARTKAQNRANVLQLKMIGQGHPTGLTASLLKLFEPRQPLEYKPPPEKRKCPPYTGMAQFVSNFAKPGDPEYAPPVQKGETPAERKARIHKIRLEEGAKKAAEEIEKYDPNNDPNISGDPYKTLFVARLNYETTESRVKREFEAYGPIKRDSFILIEAYALMRLKAYGSPCPAKTSQTRLADFKTLVLGTTTFIDSSDGDASCLEALLKVRLITDKESSKPRGYAFIEYMHTRDMKAAYKQADGKKVDNRRVLVDVERGRTVPNWRPRRLGGGLGTSRVGNEEVKQSHLGRDQVQSGGISRSEEPRVERDREREKSRERGKDREKERERSRERSHDRPKGRDHRDDRHHRDRDRTREKDRGRDRDHEKDRTRDSHRGRGRDRDRERDRDRDHHRERERERDNGDYEIGDDNDRDRGRSRDREYDYDERVDLKREHGHGNQETEPAHGNYDYYGGNRDRGEYDNRDDHERYRESDRGNDRYEQMDEDGYGYGGASKSQERDYRRSDRSLSHE
ncbi:U1 small nuclear ribonucleoprotein [Orobanche minor]